MKIPFLQVNFSILHYIILFWMISPLTILASSTSHSNSHFDSLTQKINANIQSTNTDTCVLLNDFLVLATEHQKTGEYTDAITAVRQGQAYKKPSCERYGYMYLMEGLMHYHLGKKDSALYVFSNSLDFANDNAPLRRDIHLYLGLVQVRSGYNQKAIDNFRLSAKYSKASNNTYTLLQSYSNSGVAHYNIGNKDSSLHYHKLSIKINKGECEDCKLNSYTSIGILFDEQGAADSASYYFNKVLAFENSEMSYRGVFLAPNLSMGVILYKEGKNDDALKHLQEALTLIHQYNDQDHENLIQGHTYLGAVFSSLNNPKKASYNYERSIKIMDSVQDVSIVKATAEAESKYEVKESLLQTQLLAQQNALSEEKLAFQKAVIWTSTIATIVVTFLLIILVFQRRKLGTINQTLKGLIKDKDHFMGLLTHDLRTPISTIIGNSDILMGECESNSLKETIKDIRHSAFVSLQMMDQVLDIYRFETEDYEVELETVDVAKTCRHMLIRYEPLAIAKEQLLVLNVLDSGSIKGNETLFKSIIGNVLSNAIKFNGVGGKCEISTKTQNDQVIISIKDNGPGFSEEDRVKAFNKFQKLSAQPTTGENSTGLGLYMVKVMVEKMAGSVELKSEQGKGTEVVMTF